MTEEQLNHMPGIFCGLPWRTPGKDWQWYDCDKILAAVPVRIDNDKSKWRYEFSVVTIRVDEDYFALHVEGESWGWDYEDIELFVPIKADGPEYPDPTDSEDAANAENRPRRYLPVT